MTTAAPPRPPSPPALTPDDLLQLPDGGKGYELIDGRLKEKTVSFRSSRVGVRVSWFLESYCNSVAPGWVCGSDAGFQCFAGHPNRVRRPDVAFIAYARLTREEYERDGFIPIAPDLVVEVVSPNDLAREVDGKREEWLRAGAREVWVVNPDTRDIHVYRADGGYAFLQEADAVTSPLLPGFSVPEAELFRLPGAPGQAPAAAGE